MPGVFLFSSFHLIKIHWMFVLCYFFLTTLIHKYCYFIFNLLNTLVKELCDWRYRYIYIGTYIKWWIYGPGKWCFGPDKNMWGHKCEWDKWECMCCVMDGVNVAFHVPKSLLDGPHCSLFTSLILCTKNSNSKFCFTLL